MTDLAAPPAPATRRPQASLPRRLFRRARKLTVSLLAIVGFITLARPFTFDLTPMISPSMSPALTGDGPGGDWILAEKISFHFRSPQRYDIVEFNNAEGLQLMKRVVALPGETVAIQSNTVQIGGKQLPTAPGAQPVKYYAYGNLGAGRPYTVSSGYYVLGDNSADSDDSRYNGPVPPPRSRPALF